MFSQNIENKKRTPQVAETYIPRKSDQFMTQQKLNLQLKLNNLAPDNQPSKYQITVLVLALIENAPNLKSFKM